jgi:N-acetylglucosamine-6-phosphate deacetylase
MTRFGVTSFLPTIITSPLETVAKAQSIVTEDPGKDFRGARPLGLHLEGPFLSPFKKGTHTESLLLEPSIERIENWYSDNGVSLVTLAPELPNALPVIKELVKRGIVVSAGHSNATYEEAMQGSKPGSHTAPISSTPNPLNHRKPGLVGALLTNPTMPVGIVPDGFHIHPAVVNIVWQLKRSQYLTLVTDALAGLGMPPAGTLSVTSRSSWTKRSPGNPMERFRQHPWRG